jgi:hypothetical protein
MRLVFWLALYAALTVAAVSARSASGPWLAWIDPGEYGTETEHASAAR